MDASGPNMSQPEFKTAVAGMLSDLEDHQLVSLCHSLGLERGVQTLADETLQNQTARAKTKRHALTGRRKDSSSRLAPIAARVHPQVHAQTTKDTVQLISEFLSFDRASPLGTFLSWLAQHTLQHPEARDVMPDLDGQPRLVQSKTQHTRREMRELRRARKKARRKARREVMGVAAKYLTKSGTDAEAELLEIAEAHAGSSDDEDDDDDDDDSSDEEDARTRKARRKEEEEKKQRDAEEAAFAERDGHGDGDLEGEELADRQRRLAAEAAAVEAALADPAEGGGGGGGGGAAGGDEGEPSSESDVEDTEHERAHKKALKEEARRRAMKQKFGPEQLEPAGEAPITVRDPAAGNAAVRLPELDTAGRVVVVQRAQPPAFQHVFIPTERSELRAAAMTAEVLETVGNELRADEEELTPAERRLMADELKRANAPGGGVDEVNVVPGLLARVADLERQVKVAERAMTRRPEPDAIREFLHATAKLRQLEAELRVWQIRQTSALKRRLRSLTKSNAVLGQQNDFFTRGYSDLKSRYDRQQDQATYELALRDVVEEQLMATAYADQPFVKALEQTCRAKKAEVAFLAGSREMMRRKLEQKSQELQRTQAALRHEQLQNKVVVRTLRHQRRRLAVAEEARRERDRLRVKHARLTEERDRYAMAVEDNQTRMVGYRRRLRRWRRCPSETRRRSEPPGDAVPHEWRALHNRRRYVTHRRWGSADARLPTQKKKKKKGKKGKKGRKGAKKGRGRSPGRKGAKKKGSGGKKKGAGGKKSKSPARKGPAKAEGKGAKERKTKGARSPSPAKKSPARGKSPPPAAGKAEGKSPSSSKGKKKKGKKK